MRKAILVFLLILPSLGPARAFEKTQNFDGSELPLLTGGEPNIPVTDVDPLGTLSPASVAPGIIPLNSDDPFIKPFLGIWRGQWEGTLDTYFVVTEANGDRVKVYHSWGTNALVKETGQRFVWGSIHDGVLLLPSEVASISLKVQDDHNLFGLYYSKMVHVPSRIILTRQAP